MNNGAKDQRNSRRRGCRRNESSRSSRRQNQRGGAGEAYTLGGFVAGAPIINNYGQEIVRFASCEEAVRPGYLETAQIKGGLPGFSGGGRRGNRKGSRKAYRKAYYGGAETPGSPFPQTYASETSAYVPKANGPEMIPNPVPGATNTVSGARALATAKIGGSMSGFRGGVLETGADQVASQMGGSLSDMQKMMMGMMGTGAGNTALQMGGSLSDMQKMMGMMGTGAGNMPLQMGGRYGFDTSIVGPSGIAIPGHPYTGCGTGLEALSDPFNKVQATSLITAPPPTEAAYKGQFMPMSGGKKNRCWTRKGRKGRRSACRKQNGGVGGVDSMFYSAPRSGYTHTPSDGAGGAVGSTLSDGRTPFLLNVPYSAQVVPSPNCLKTGGRRVSRKNRKGSRKSRKSRKSRRANRKN